MVICEGILAMRGEGPLKTVEFGAKDASPTTVGTLTAASSVTVAVVEPPGRTDEGNRVMLLMAPATTVGWTVRMAVALTLPQVARTGTCMVANGAFTTGVSMVNWIWVVFLRIVTGETGMVAKLE